MSSSPHPTPGHEERGWRSLLPFRLSVSPPLARGVYVRVVCCMQVCKAADIGLTPRSLDENGLSISFVPPLHQHLFVNFPRKKCCATSSMHVFFSNTLAHIHKRYCPFLRSHCNVRCGRWTLGAPLSPVSANCTLVLGTLS